MLGTGLKAAPAPCGRRRVRVPVPIAVPPDFLFFDLGNVLFTFDRERAFRQMAAVSGVDPCLIDAVVMAGGLQAELECGRISWEEFHAAFSRRTGSASDPAALRLAASDMFTLNVEMLPVIAALERLGRPMGILSNTCAIHWRHLLESGHAILPGRFTRHVLSHEAGVMKPDAAIFAAATAAAGVPPDRIFFCDDLPEHVAAARRAGWDAECFVTAATLVDQLSARGLRLPL